MFVFVASEDEDVNERNVKVYNTSKNETCFWAITLHCGKKVEKHSLNSQPRELILDGFSGKKAPTIS